VAKLIQHSNLTKHLKYDKDKNCNKSNNAEMKTTVVKDRNKMQQENEYSIQKAEVKVP
jgi:hypothetical protein